MDYNKLTVIGKQMNDETPLLSDNTLWYVNNIQSPSAAVNDVYFYYVLMCPPMVFTDVIPKHGHEFFIPEHVLGDARGNKCRIIIDTSTESFSGGYDRSVFMDVEMFMRRHCLPPRSLIFVTGNLLAENNFQKSVSYRIVSQSMLECWFTDPKTPPVEFKPAEQFLYLNLNRRTRQHRLWLLCELHKEGLLDSGINSFNLDDFPADFGMVHQYNPLLRENYDALVQEKVRFVDVSTQQNQAFSLNMELYEKTFLTLTTETTLQDDALQFSEKVWKPLAVGHPFMLLGTSNSLALLHEYGFETFHHWFDESYDKIDDVNKKIGVMVDNLKRLSSYDIESLKQIRHEMNEVVTYNQLKYRQRIKNLFVVKDNDRPYSSRPILDLMMREYAKMKSGQ